MKTRFTWLGIVAACILGISAAFIGCENDVNAIVQYEGKVVHKGTTSPYPDLEVKITNGDKIHTVDHTNTNGNFTLNVRVNEIDGSYYVLVGDSSCVTKRIELSSYGQAKVDLGTIEIEGPSLPTVSTKAISDISDNKATSGGNVTADGRSSVTARGVCWSKSEYPTIDDEHTQNGSGLGEFKSQITNIEAGATYYVRAYATNRMGTAYGDQLVLSTKTGLPQVTTDDVSNIYATTATCGGDVADNSGYPIIARGVCWSDKTATPTINNDHTEEVATTGHFTSLMIGLERNTTYYVRAYAVNEKGTNYGETKIFTTLSGLPTVTTSDISEIKASSAKGGGNVTSNGGYTITARGICWSSTSSTPTVDDAHTSEVADNGAFTSLMTGLSANTTYYVRAYATNEAGTSYGESVVFTSGNGLPSIITTSVTKDSQTILSGGNITDDGGFPIIARGICYGNFPHPDLSATYIHTSDGTGTGYFTSIIDGSTTGVVHVRAYATNANGTAYGEEFSIDLDYLSLPTFVFNGSTYHVAPNAPNTMTWNDAKIYCEGLVLYGYSDWKLPNSDELYQMYVRRDEIGNFITEYISSNIDVFPYFYWSRSTQGNFYDHDECYYYINFITGTTGCRQSKSEYFSVRPIRVGK